MQVFYLYPSRCVGCDLKVAGECDYCTSYYDERVMGLLSEELGVEIKWFKTDVVDRPNVFVVSGDRVGLGDARNKHNIAHTVCEITGMQRVCRMFNEEIDRAATCAEKHGIDKNSIIYHYVTKGCNTCVRTTPIINELSGLMYDDTQRYNVKLLDHNKKDELNILNDCFSSIVNLDYVPQIICPATGKDLSGDFTLSILRDFADACIEAK